MLFKVFFFFFFTIILFWEKKIFWTCVQSQLRNGIRRVCSYFHNKKRAHLFDPESRIL